MHIAAAWILLALPPVAAASLPLPAAGRRPRRSPIPPDAGPVFDPSDEELLKDGNVPSDGPGLVEYFRQRVLRADDEAHVKALIRQLADDDFDRREEASIQLCGVGLRAKPMLLAALANPDAEVVHRARECLRQIDEGTASASTAAAMRMLARQKPDGAAAALLDFLPAAGEEELAEQARLALADLAVRDGKADPALVRALTDASAMKRGAAAFALGRGGAEDQLPAVRKLLQDPDPLVRYRAGMALAAAREKSAVPALIDLLDQLPRREASRVEEMLYRVAGDKAPPPSAPGPGRPPQVPRRLEGVVGRRRRQAGRRPPGATPPAPSATPSSSCSTRAASWSWTAPTIRVWMSASSTSHSTPSCCRTTTS